jgi:hypothetical protein
MDTMGASSVRCKIRIHVRVRYPESCKLSNFDQSAAGLLAIIVSNGKKEMRATTENLNALVEHARGGVAHTAGILGDTVQRVHETVQDTSRSFLVTLASIVAGFRATTGIVKTLIHREGGTVNGK